ncbi:hypothetical protein INS49_014014 [Diaporthe citri]|uniref:uncharacterized protein n=1 Tax=Diaporthe citri TaxID=83186 RepID=UPI001C80A869|nr:uncharacterized protein INS49_014014 [Diaporthe citri]KAG6358130.1 hypothetical protein INS49_014014 [Diaporthe citri]
MELRTEMGKFLRPSVNQSPTLEKCIFNQVSAREPLPEILFPEDTNKPSTTDVLGEGACDYIYLGVFGESMCKLTGGWFTAPDGCSYQFTGCGTGLGNFCLSNEDGSLKSCPLVWDRHDREGDGCSNEYGSYWVDRYFIFWATSSVMPQGDVGDSACDGEMTMARGCVMR